MKPADKIKKEHPSLDTLRHSCSHVMAHAVFDLFPGTKFAIGPPIENGFYYDFYPPKPFEPDDLPGIEKRMREIIEKDQPFHQAFKTRKEAKKILKDEKYKLELLEDIPDEKISFYTMGKFTDLCRGPHIEKTSPIRHFKLLSIAGAYWRGDEKRDSLQRIYGTVFDTEEELKTYLHNIEEARKRDHRIVGKALDLYSIQEKAGAGLVFWHPRGALIRHIMETHWKEEHLKKGYQLVNIPHIAHIDLWKTSGHLDFYREYMYSPIKIDEQEYILKPMNCPGHILIYKTNLHSYREMPIKYAELGTVYRYERSGVLHGLLRVRGFTQDDAHIFCRPEQLTEEICNVIDLTLHMLRIYGFSDYETSLSTRPEKFVGTREGWDAAEHALKDAMEKSRLSYDIDPGSGVFYGPKIDIKIKDCLGRLWQCSTIQVDFNIPERFNVNFRNAKGKDEQVIMIHRALMGSLERFFGVLIEHYRGAFPVWLAPVQVAVLPVTDAHIQYATEVKQELLNRSVRVETDMRNEKLGFKIREATLQKIPYIVIVGNKELEAKKVTVRMRDGEDRGLMTPDRLIDEIARKVHDKVLDT